MLDPFLGNESTAIAADKLKRPWVGIEQSANYVSMAARRIGKMRDVIDELQNRLHDIAQMKTTMKKAPLPEPTRGPFMSDKQWGLDIKRRVAATHIAGCPHF